MEIAGHVPISCVADILPDPPGQHGIEVRWNDPQGGEQGKFRLKCRDEEQKRIWTGRLKAVAEEERKRDQVVGMLDQREAVNGFDDDAGGSFAGQDDVTIKEEANEQFWTPPTSAQGNTNKNPFKPAPPPPPKPQTLRHGLIAPEVEAYWQGATAKAPDQAVANPAIVATHPETGSQPISMLSASPELNVKPGPTIPDSHKSNRLSFRPPQIRIKIHSGNEIYLLTIATLPPAFRDFRIQVLSKAGFPSASEARIKFKDEDGDLVNLEEREDLELLIESALAEQSETKTKSGPTIVLHIVV